MTYDELLALVNDVRRARGGRVGGMAWVVNPEMMASLCVLKDHMGRYAVTYPTMQGGGIEMFGYPVRQVPTLDEGVVYLMHDPGRGAVVVRREWNTVEVAKEADDVKTN